METRHICKLNKISKQGVRYYENLGLISPKRKANGYREYSLTDIKKLSSIMLFRYFDLPLESIETLLNQRDINKTLSFLSEKLEEMNEEVRELRKKEILLQKYIQHIEKTKNISKNEIIVSKQGKRYAIASKESQVDLGESFCESKKLFQDSINKPSINGFNLYGNMVKKSEGVLKFRPIFLLNGDEKLKNKNRIIIPEGIYFVVVLHEPFDREKVFEDILKYSDQHGYALSNYVLEFYLVTFYESTNLEEHLTRIEVKAEKKERLSVNGEEV